MYNLDSDNKIKIEKKYKNLGFINQFRIRISYQKLTICKWPTLKDEQNYTYSKKQNNENMIYYYCTEHDKLKCKGSLIVKMERDQNNIDKLELATIKIIKGNNHVEAVHDKKNKIDIIIDSAQAKRI